MEGGKLEYLLRKSRFKLQRLKHLGTLLFRCLFIGKRLISCLSPRQGSIIADLELTFNDSVGESNVNALLTKAANKGKIGDLKVEDFSIGKTFPG